MKIITRTTAAGLFFFALFAAPAMAQHTVALSWTASITSGATYNVYRQQACSGNFTQINASAVTATVYTDSAVAPGETYCYQVTALLSGVESTASNLAPATIPGSSVQSSNSQGAAKSSCTRRGTFVEWAKCVAALPRKSK
jgi:fibronectin type 3 domain-containing protein